MGSGAAFGIDAASLAGTHAGVELHGRDPLGDQGRPSGSMALPTPARTCVVVFMDHLPSGAAVQPLSSMRIPAPART